MSMSDTLTISSEPYEGSLTPVSTSVVTYRPATLEDELHLTTVFSRMLRELEPMGHSILPTEHNLDVFDELFLRAIVLDKHGIVLAFTGGQCIGGVFSVSDPSGLDTAGKLAVNCGVWVDPAWRRQGVATRLQALSHTRLRRSGFKQVVSTVLKTNEAGFRAAIVAGAEVTSYYTTTNLQEAE